jgi:hypothetical protein
MNNKMVETDERTSYIARVSCTYGYNFLAFGLLIDVIYRSLRFGEAPWDLLGLVIASGFVMTAYQFKQKILGRSWVKATVIISAAAAVVAALIVLIGFTK